MRPGHADVVNHRHADAHPIERFAGLFGDRQIAGAGGDDGHEWLRIAAALFRCMQSKRAGYGVVAPLGKHFEQAGRLRRVDPSWRAPVAHPG